MRNSFPKILVTLLLLNLSAASVIKSEKSHAFGLMIKEAGWMDKSCLISPTDPHEIPVRISKDSVHFPNRCANSAKYRPAVILEDSDEALRFANYLHFHDGVQDFFTANIPKATSVKKVFYQIVRFPVIQGVEAAHVQIRFVLDQEILLTSQGGKKVTKANDVLVSFEGVLPQNENYNFALGAFDNYPFVGRVTSGMFKLSEYENEMEQYEIALPPSEKNELLFNTIRRSSELGMTTYYNTLRPNCTTEIFDLIDQLPSQKGKNEPFLTVISNDPIAGPSLEALEERGVLGPRFANLREDLLKNETQAPPVVVKDEPPYFYETKDQPYSLVVFAPSGANSSSSLTKQTLLKVKSLAYEQLPVLLQSVGSSLLVSKIHSESLDPSQILISTLKALTAELNTQLLGLKESLPENPEFVTVYFSPWKKELGRKINPLKELKIQARLPFDTFEVENQDLKRSSLLYGAITNGIRDTMSMAALDAHRSKLYFLSASFNIRLERKNPEVRLQALLGLHPLLLDQNTVNDQVKISEFEVPKSKSLFYQPVTLIELTQSTNSKIPKLEIKFGAFGGLYHKKAVIGVDEAHDFRGSVQLLEPIATNEACELRNQSVPRLNGTFGPKAHANPVVAKVLNGKSVSFSIFSVGLDLQTQQVSDMDIRVSTWPIDCISDPVVNNDFKTQANLVIDENLKSKLNKQGLVEVFLNKILQSEKESASGF